MFQISIPLSNIFKCEKKVYIYGMVAGLKFLVPHFLRKMSSSKPKAFLCQVSPSDQKTLARILLSTLLFAFISAEHSL